MSKKIWNNRQANTVRNSSWSSLMGEKEKDTEAKITKREHQGEPPTGEPNVMTDKPANRRKRN